MQRHEQIVRHFTRSIFSGELKAGEKLPVEKQLTEQLGVDRTTLRQALKQLESMHVITIRQGDGMYVRDYTKGAGLDFLRVLFQYDDHTLEIDPYLVDEIWEFWNLYLPGVLELAARRASAREVGTLMRLYEEQRACLGDIDRMVELDLQAQDLIGDMVDNRVLLMLHNSSRPLRKRLLQIHCRLPPMGDMAEELDEKIRLFRVIFGSNDAARTEALSTLTVALSFLRARMQKHLVADPSLLQQTHSGNESGS